MCGIFGALYRRPLERNDLAAFRSAVKSLEHRGPDGQGEWVDREAGVYLGHRRLAILDLSKSNAQPMRRDDAVLTYNGEVYNFKELRSQLERTGVEFSTAGDTEVLLRAWQAWGSQAFARIDGMFAAAFWDGARATFAIDSFGEKPLFYATPPDGVLFASELPPLVSLTGAAAEMDEQRLAAYMALSYVPAPQTAYPNIHRLRAGSWLQVDRGTPGPAQRYWAPPRPPPSVGRVRPLSEADLDAIVGALTRSLERRLHADVPMCLFLSGGVDSSLVAALAAVELKQDVEAITVGYPNSRRSDESDYAAAVAAHLGLKHRVVVSDDHPDTVSIERILDLFGQPNGNITVLSVHQMAAAAAGAGYKVGLTGIGGDEIFYGYRKHAFASRYRLLLDAPQALRRAVGRAAAPLDSVKRVRLFRRLVGIPDHEVYLAMKVQQALPVLRRLPGFPKWCKAAFRDLRPPFGATIPYYELVEVLPNSHLTAVDVGSMRASIELRTPFLSRDVVDVVSKFEHRSLLRFGQKSVLRRILRRYIPDDLAERPKKSFIYPNDRFLMHVGKRTPAVRGIPPGLLEDVSARLDQAPEWPRLLIYALVLERALQAEGGRRRSEGRPAVVQAPAGSAVGG